jgi:hypothetical protein
MRNEDFGDRDFDVVGDSHGLARERRRNFRVVLLFLPDGYFVRRGQSSLDWIRKDDLYRLIVEQTDRTNYAEKVR